MNRSCQCCLSATSTRRASSAAAERCDFVLTVATLGRSAERVRQRKTAQPRLAAVNRPCLELFEIFRILAKVDDVHSDGIFLELLGEFDQLLHVILQRWQQPQPRLAHPFRTVQDEQRRLSIRGRGCLQRRAHKADDALALVLVLPVLQRKLRHLSPRNRRELTESSRVQQRLAE